MRVSITLALAFAVPLLLPSSAHADDPAPVEAAPPSAPPPPPAHPAAPGARSYPAIGGHLGMAVPIVTIGSQTTAVGADFVTVGITPGVTVHLDEDWAIDLEFIAFNEIKNTPAATTFVVDPGIVRKFEGFSAGLRVATQVGAPTNVGLVPIVVVPFKVSERVSYFVEGDIPLFLRDDGTKMQPSATFLFQTGVGF